MLRRFFIFFALALLFLDVPHPAQPQERAPSGHCAFAWAGDSKRQGRDFLAVIDADPASPAYGHLMTTLMTDQQTMRVHHTEYVMPASGMLFANDHEAGRTFIFDLRDPLHPKIESSFTEMAGYMHPHSYVRACRTVMCWPHPSASPRAWAMTT
jgi:56kDa selenium binding protein (SBP56)